MASGTAASFSSPGFAVAVADDSSTTFKATATDAAGNVSSCSSGTTYVEDSTQPASSVTFPAAGGNYSPAGWDAGCATAGFCGTASDGIGVQKVELSIRRGAGNYFDGSSFSSGSEIYLQASGTTSWSYAFASGQFPADGQYTIHVKATDVAGNVEAFSSRSFVFDTSAPSAPTVSFSALTNAVASGQTVYFRARRRRRLHGHGLPRTMPSRGSAPTPSRHWARAGAMPQRARATITASAPRPPTRSSRTT